MISSSGNGSGMHDSHPVFNRFWRHYEASMAWMHTHYATIRQLNAEFDQLQRSEMIPPANNKGPSSNKRRKWQNTRNVDGDHSEKSAVIPKKSNQIHNDHDSRQRNIIDPDVENAGQEYIERIPEVDEEDMEAGEEYEAPISEEVLDFFEVSRRHREQRDLEASQRHYENLENLMISSRPSAVNSGADTSAVFEARQRELKQLYGSQAATIHGMEMAVQCGFERFCQGDVKLWPNIPLRL